MPAKQGILALGIVKHGSAKPAKKCSAWQGIALNGMALQSQHCMAPHSTVVHRTESQSKVMDLLPLLKSEPFWPTPVPKRRLRLWIYRGASDGRGGRIRLRTVRLVGRLYVRREDAEEFLRLTHWTAPIVQPKPTRAEKVKEERELESFKKQLKERYGITA